MEVNWEMAFVTIIGKVLKILGSGGSGGTASAFEVTAKAVCAKSGIMALD
jgi:hypothetical protein